MDADKYSRSSANYRYRAWLGMVSRCTRPTHKAWADYGGRGIIVCARWLENFAAFVDDIGERPSAKHSIDRRDNDLGYSPDNCKWATSSEQARNRRPPTERKNCIRIDGLSLTALAKAHNLNRSTLKLRYRMGKRGADLIAPDLRNGSFWRGKRRQKGTGKAMMNGEVVLR